MFLTGLRGYLHNADNDAGERGFVLFSVASIVCMAISCMFSSFSGDIGGAAVFAGGLALFVAGLILFGTSRKRFRLITRVQMLFLIYIFLPLVFFAKGGIYGGSVAWFGFVSLCIGVIVEGRTRVAYLILELICGILCWNAGQKHPEYLARPALEMLYIDSFFSMLIISVIMVIMINYQAAIYVDVNKRSEKRKEEIEKLSEAQNRFFSSMSHELRSPINTIIGINEMILRENASPEINEDALYIRSAGNLLLHLVNDILDISKLKTGQMHLVLSPYDLGSMLSDVAAMLVHPAQEKGLVFQMDVADDVPSGLLGDEIRIKQILINVLNNAIKYTEEGFVWLTVESERKNDREAIISFTIADTGIGIRREDIPGLFSAFSRVEEERNRYIEGTGLGLSIVKQFVDMMEGTIAVNSV